jgi:hypothetical protein
MQDENITISKNWLERLIRIANKIESESDPMYKEKAWYDIQLLIGYISSAQTILNNQK